MEDEFLSKEDLNLLQSTRQIRLQLVKELGCEKEGIIRVPEDKADKTMITSLLKHMDDEVINRARLKAASKATDGITNAAAVVAEALRRFQPGLEKREAGNPVQLPSSVPEIETLPGQMDIGTQNLTRKDLVVPIEADLDD